MLIYEACIKAIEEADVGPEDSDKVVLVINPGATGSDRVSFTEYSLDDARAMLTQIRPETLAGFFFITPQMSFTHPDLVWP